jgi:hypothetical protein
MFGIFGKNKGGKSASDMPEILHFKGNEGAFDYACKYFDDGIKEKQALTAILLDPAKQSDTLQLMLETMSKGENIYTAYILKIASADGGFKALGLCYNKTAQIRGGDLVFWVPMQRNPAFSTITPDNRSAWMGGIVAKLAPSYSLKSGSFEIVERFA